MPLHEVIHYLVVSEAAAAFVQHQPMDFIHETHRLLQVQLDRVLWNLLTVVHFLVVQESPIEFDVSLAYRDGTL